jgi:hypothetical protein
VTYLQDAETTVRGLRIWGSPWQPRFFDWVFGHVHASYGSKERGGTLFVNASTCDRMYRPVHPPVVVDL